MADPFVAEIRMFPFNFAPRGWAFCAGQLLPISQNTALFSLLGTTYGGDGKSTFALPNMQGNVPVHPGQGPGLSLYDLGQEGGSEFVTLIESEMPNHTHTFTASEEQANENNPGGNVPAGGVGIWTAGNAGGLTPMAFQTLSLTGGSLPHNNMMPYLTVNFCIALQGVFPARN
ncbi:MAG: phage tail protein [Acidobacteria bacterium]|nr:phage tail protein [Acidobacteriota bacterium]